MSENNQEPTGEQCQRCGLYGEDRRTLFMACLYAMDELGLPFKQVKVVGKSHEFTGMKNLRTTEDPRFPPLRVPEFSAEPKGEVDRNFFTLRVCKACRSDWMGAIKSWFTTPPEASESCGSGIFIREYGKLKEITQEEWERRHAEKEARRE